MKEKLITIIVIFLSLLGLQLYAYADMDAPQINPYTATISNPNGAKYYEWEEDGYKPIGTLEYGTEIEITYEEERDDGTVYGHFTLQNEKYSINFATIKISDLTILEENKFTKNYADLEKPIDAIILKEGGIEIHQGPAEGYSILDTKIPKGTKVKMYDFKGEDGTGFFTPWFYVEYAGVSGWICELYGAIGYEDEYIEEMVTYKDTLIYKYSFYTGINNQIVQVIPANTEIKDFYDIDDWSWGKYVTYNGISGYVHSEDYASASESWTPEPWVLTYTAKMYKEGNTNSEVLVEEIPKGTELSYTIYGDLRATGWIYTEYNGVSGWVYYIEVYGETEEENENIVNSALSDLKELEIEEAKLLDSHKQGNLEFVENEDLPENIIDEEIILDGEIDSQEGSDKEILELSGKQIVIISVFIGIVIALTAFVTIILVNKTNKTSSKNDSNSDSENKE